MKQKKTIIVTPNNSGSPSDEPNIHYNSAKKELVGWIHKFFKFQSPILIPTFPRPKKDWKIYTHALNRASINTKTKDIRRVDLQLIDMIRRAKEELLDKKILVDNKVVMFGFSAAGSFTNRFTLLHPLLVKAAVFGSPGGWATAPVQKWKNQALDYPIGIADLKELAGISFNSDAFKKVPVFHFLGEKDLNDSVIFRDGFEETHEKIIRNNFGNTPVSRWEVSKNLFKKSGCKCTFKLYPKMYHEINEHAWKDIKKFIKENIH